MLETTVGALGAGSPEGRTHSSVSSAECAVVRRTQCVLPEGVAAGLAGQTRASVGHAKPTSCIWGDSLREVHLGN